MARPFTYRAIIAQHFASWQLLVLCIRPIMPIHLKIPHVSSDDFLWRRVGGIQMEFE